MLHLFGCGVIDLGQELPPLMAPDISRAADGTIGAGAITRPEHLPMQTALEGLRVLDLSTTLAGAWAARMFGDYGADVLLAEPPEGHALRAAGPFAGDASLLHSYVNWNKRGAALHDAPELASGADLLITTGDPAAEGIAAAISRLPDTAVHLSITPHGLSGPLAGTPGDNLTACATVGWAQINRCEGEGPLQLPTHQTGYIAGVAAFIGGAAALVRRGSTGTGDLVDVSEAEALAQTCAPWALMGIYVGGDRVARGPVGRRSRNNAGPLWRTADGLINYGYGDWAQWTNALSSLGLDDLANDPNLIPQLGRNQHDTRPVRDGLADASATRNKWDIFHTLAGYRCISGVVQNSAELLANEQLNARGFFVESRVGDVAVRAPGAPAKLSATPWRLQQPAPAHLGAHKWQAPGRTPAAASGNAVGTGPLAGIRVLAFTQAWAGTWCTELLSLLGAHVVQIESRKRADVWRGAGAPVPPGVRREGLTQHGHNTNGMYNSVNLNKHAITLDMQHPDGKAMFWDMVPNFDVMVDNFSPHVMPNWGVTLETLHEKRPDMIFASISGYGIGGPLSEYAANGATTEPMAGLASIHGYRGDEAANTGGLIPDPICGYYMTSAILAAVLHRQQTGEGQRIDLAMMEAVAVQVGDAIAEQSATGNIRGPSGNSHSEAAPYGYFETTEDNWLAISVHSDTEWQALLRHMGRQDLETDSRFASTPERVRNADAANAVVAAWARGREAFAEATALGALGIAAAESRPFMDIYRRASPQFAARGFLRAVTHPEAGTHLVATLPFQYRAGDLPAVRYSPCFGEHSAEVLQRELGIDDTRVAELVDAGITGTERIYK